jgi:uncharacterized OB-fold protein
MVTQGNPIPGRDYSDVSLSTWWDSIKDNTLTLPWCQSCMQFHFYPEPFCPHCGSGELSAGNIAGKGTLYSFTIVHRAPSALFKDDIPYVLGVIKTQEGPHLMARIECVSADKLQIGLPVHFKCLKSSPHALAALYPVFVLT